MNVFLLLSTIIEQTHFQNAAIRASVDKPQQLLHDSPPKHLLRRQQRNHAISQRKSHLRTENASRSGVGAIGSKSSMVQNVANQIQVLEFFVLLSHYLLRKPRVHGEKSGREAERIRGDVSTR